MLSNNQSYLQLKVAFPLKGFATFSYLYDENVHGPIHIGARVLVPFGRKKEKLGLVLDIQTEIEQTDFEQKEVLELLDVIPLANQYSVALLKFTSSYYLSGIGELLFKCYPKSFFLSSETKISVGPNFSDGISIFNEQFFLLKSFLDHSSITFDQYRKQFNYRGALKQLKEAEAQDVIQFNEELFANQSVPTEKWIVWNTSEHNLAKTIQDLERAPKQQELFLAIYQKVTSNQLTDFSIREIRNLEPYQSPLLNALEKKGYIDIETRAASIDTGLNVIKQEIALSSAQESVVKDMLESDSKVHFLHGISASGKTEMYCQLIQRQTKYFEHQALILFPDHILSHLLVGRIAQYLDTSVVVLAPHISEEKKNAIWKGVAENTIKVVIGSSNAIFLPFQDLISVVIDEEHEASYKELYSPPLLNYRDLAIYLAHLHSAKCTLVSATPSLESSYNIKQGKYAAFKLDEKFYGTSGLETEWVAIDNQKSVIEQQTVLTKQTLQKVQEVLQKNQKVLVFRNARGYALSAICRSCGQVIMCDNCDIRLVYHKSQNELRCHICASKYELPDYCPDCESEQALLIQGIGTQKVEEELQIEFPDIPIIRFDSDSAKGQKKQQELLNLIQQDEAQIIVGNRTISKGIDFAGVALIVFAQAESLLTKTDFRSIEYSYQLLTQLVGRAGRRGEQVKLLFQTYQSKFPEIKSILEINQENFIESELLQRKEFAFPPIIKMIQLFIRSRDYYEAVECAKFAHNVLSKELPALSVLSPIATPESARMKGFFFFYMTIKVARNKEAIRDTKAILKRLISGVQSDSKFRKTVIYPNVDP